MCYIREISYTCGHVRKEIIGGPCAAALNIANRQEGPAAQAEGTPQIEKACTEYYDSDERVFEGRDCGAGGSFVRCVERQELDTYRTEVLRRCEARTQMKATKLFEQMDRITAVTRKFRPDIWGRTTATVEFQILIEKANEQFHEACRDLGDSLQRRGHTFIVCNTDTKRDKDGINNLVARFGCLISRWEIVQLGGLKEVVNALEMEARKPENLSGPKLGKDTDATDEGERAMDLIYREIHDQHAGKTDPETEEDIGAEHIAQIDRSENMDIDDDFDIDIWGE